VLRTRDLIYSLNYLVLIYSPPFSQFFGKFIKNGQSEVIELVELSVSKDAKINLLTLSRDTDPRIMKNKMVDQLLTIIRHNSCQGFEINKV